LRNRSILTGGLLIAPLVAFPAYVWGSRLLEFSRVEIDQAALLAVLGIGLAGVININRSRRTRIVLGVGYLTIIVPLLLLVAIVIGCRFGPCYWTPF